MKLAKIASVFLASILLAISYLPIKDAFIGVPYTYILEPVIYGDNHFSVAVKIGCNRFDEREIGMIIDPPVFIESVSDIYASITGNVKLEIEQGRYSLSKTINLSYTGNSINSQGVWSKLIYRFDPIGSVWCSDQYIKIEVSDLNISLSDHSVSIYISRDRRP